VHKYNDAAIGTMMGTKTGEGNAEEPK